MRQIFARLYAAPALTPMSLAPLIIFLFVVLFAFLKLVIVLVRRSMSPDAEILRFSRTMWIDALAAGMIGFMLTASLAADLGKYYDADSRLVLGSILCEVASSSGAFFLFVFIDVRTPLRGGLAWFSWLTLGFLINFFFE